MLNACKVKSFEGLGLSVVLHLYHKTKGVI